MVLANSFIKTEEGTKEIGEMVKCKAWGNSITSLIVWPMKESGGTISSKEKARYLMSFPKLCLAFLIIETLTMLNNSG